MDFISQLLNQSPTLYTKQVNYMKSNKVQQRCHTTQAAAVADQSVTGIISGKLHHDKMNKWQSVM